MLFFYHTIRFLPCLALLSILFFSPFQSTLSLPTLWLASNTLHGTSLALTKLQTIVDLALQTILLVQDNYLPTPTAIYYEQPSHHGRGSRRVSSSRRPVPTTVKTFVNQAQTQQQLLKKSQKQKQTSSSSSSVPSASSSVPPPRLNNNNTTRQSHHSSNSSSSSSRLSALPSIPKHCQQQQQQQPPQEQPHKSRQQRHRHRSHRVYANPPFPPTTFHTSSSAPRRSNNPSASSSSSSSSRSKQSSSSSSSSSTPQQPVYYHHHHHHNLHRTHLHTSFHTPPPPHHHHHHHHSYNHHYNNIFLTQEDHDYRLMVHGPKKIQPHPILLALSSNMMIRLTLLITLTVGGFFYCVNLLERLSIAAHAAAVGTTTGSRGRYYPATFHQSTTSSSSSSSSSVSVSVSGGGSTGLPLTGSFTDPSPESTCSASSSSSSSNTSASSSSSNNNTTTTTFITATSTTAATVSVTRPISSSFSELETAENNQQVKEQEEEEESRELLLLLSRRRRMQDSDMIVVDRVTSKCADSIELESSSADNIINDHDNDEDDVATTRTTSDGVDTTHTELRLLLDRLENANRRVEVEVTRNEGIDNNHNNNNNNNNMLVVNRTGVFRKGERSNGYEYWPHDRDQSSLSSSSSSAAAAGGPLSSFSNLGHQRFGHGRDQDNNDEFGTEQENEEEEEEEEEGNEDFYSDRDPLFNNMLPASMWIQCEPNSVVASVDQKRENQVLSMMGSSSSLEKESATAATEAVVAKGSGSLLKTVKCTDIQLSIQELMGNLERNMQTYQQQQRQEQQQQQGQQRVIIPEPVLITTTASSSLSLSASVPLSKPASVPLLSRPSPTRSSSSSSSSSCTLINPRKRSSFSSFESTKPKNQGIKTNFVMVRRRRIRRLVVIAMGSNTSFKNSRSSWTLFSRPALNRT